MIRNAIWNVSAGIAGAILTVALPPVLTRLMPVETFGGWVFCLQVAGYMNILGLGLQTVVSKMVAVAKARGDTTVQDEILSTAVLMLLLAGMVGMAGMFLFSKNISDFFPSAAPDLHRDMQYALIWLAASFMLILPATAINGLFIGLERNRYYAFPSIVTKILTFVVVILAWNYAQTLIAMGVGWLIATILGTIFLLTYWRKYAPQIRFSFKSISYTSALELGRDAMGLTLWNVAMLLVSGLHLLIVARVAHQDIGIYGISSALVLMIVGFMGAFAGAITPRSANLIATQNYKELAKIARSMTLLVICLGCAATLMLSAWADFILRLWGGKTFTQVAPAILAILAFAHCVRNLGLVYVMIAVGAGQQRNMLLTPLMEGIVSISASVVLGRLYGSVGVASGMLIGAFVGVGLLVWHNILRQINTELDFFKILKPLYLTALVPVALTTCLVAGAALLKTPIPIGLQLLSTACAIFLLVPCIRNILAQKKLQGYQDRA